MSITITQEKYQFKPVTLVIDSEDDLELIVESLRLVKFTAHALTIPYFDQSGVEGTARRAEVERIVRRLEQCGNLE
jgi:hypothetical protein